MTPLTPQHVLINPQGNVTFSCPECNGTRTAAVISYRDLHAPIGVECNCGAYFDIVISTRQHYRQDVELPGTYTLLGTSAALSMTVKNLSASGVGFRMTPPFELRVDDELELCFQLDDADRTPFYSLAIVRWVQDGIVGAEFDHQSADQPTLRLDVTSPVEKAPLIPGGTSVGDHRVRGTPQERPSSSRSEEGIGRNPPNPVNHSGDST